MKFSVDFSEPYDIIGNSSVIYINVHLICLEKQSTINVNAQENSGNKIAKKSGDKKSENIPEQSSRDSSLYMHIQNLCSFNKSLVYYLKKRKKIWLCHYQ